MAEFSRRGISILGERTGINTAKHYFSSSDVRQVVGITKDWFFQTKGGIFFPYTRTKSIRTRPVFSHLDRASLTNKEFTLWPKQTSLLQYKAAALKRAI